MDSWRGGVRSGQHQSSGGGWSEQCRTMEARHADCLGGTCQAARNTHSRCCARLKLTEHTPKKVHETITSYWLICLRCTALAFDVLHLPSMYCCSTSKVYCCSTSKAVVSTSRRPPQGSSQVGADLETALLAAQSGAFPWQRHHCSDAARARGHVPHPCRHSQWGAGLGGGVLRGGCPGYDAWIVTRIHSALGWARARDGWWGARALAPVGRSRGQPCRGYGPTEAAIASPPPLSPALVCRGGAVASLALDCACNPCASDSAGRPASAAAARTPPPPQRCYRAAADGESQRSPPPPAVVAMPAAPVRWRLSRWGRGGGGGKAVAPSVSRPFTDDVHLHRRRFVFSPSCFFCCPFYSSPLSCPLSSSPIPPTITRPTCDSRPSPDGAVSTGGVANRQRYCP